MIVAAVMSHRSISKAVESLRNSPTTPKMLQKLSRGTVREWFDADFKLKPHIKLRWESGKSKTGGMGARYSLADYSELEMYLLAISTSGEKVV
jgi:hypothetical protein